MGNAVTFAANSGTVMVAILFILRIGYTIAHIEPAARFNDVLLINSAFSIVFRLWAIQLQLKDGKS